MSAQVTITQLPAAGAITGTEAVPIVQNGQTVQTTTAALAGSPIQTQTFITKNQEPTLANSRALSSGTGVGLVDGGAQSTLQITLNGVSGSLETASNGIIVKSGGSVLSRTLTATGSGLNIADGSGVSGNPTFSLTGVVASVAGLSGTGMLALTGGGTTVAGRDLTGTANQIVVVDGNGSTGAPTFSIASNVVLPGTASMTIPKGTNGEQPVGADGQFRFNTTTSTFDGYAAGSWRQFSLAGGVTTFSAGGTGFTPSTGTSGAVVLGGTLNASSGGTGANTLTGYVFGNGTSAMTASSTIPTTALSGTVTNAQLANSAITINGSSVSLGGSVTVTATATNALTIGTGLTGTSYNGSAAVTIGIDSTVATLTGTQTLTNKTISGASNTLTNIANASLTNSQITLGTTNIALGGTSLTPAGLTSVTVTQNPVAALDLATKQYVDTLVSSGITYHAPVKYEVPSGNLTATYNNGAAGVGATLTNAGALVAFTPDGVVASVADRILIYNQTNQAQNGVYVVTTVGDGATAWVLTRASDADTYALKSPNGLGEGDAFFITSGNTGAGETYVCNTVGVITFGTTAITFVQISATQIYSAGTGLTLTGTQFSISNTAVTAGAYGSASSVPNYTVNAQGQLTLASNTAIAINGNQITSGTVAIANGGTGQTTASTAFNALSPITTTGDLIIGTGVNTASRLAIGANGYLLTSDGTTASWVAAPASGVTTFSAGTTGLTPSSATGGAITLAGTLAVANGGTGLTAGTSGGILAYTATGTLASSGLLAANALMIGGGAGVAPSTVTTGTGVVTALGVNVGSAGAFVTFNGALGTPSSGTVTNLTGTASININGTVGATSTNTGAFTTVAATTVTATTGIFGGTF
jgi:hypothetical protein